MTEGRKLPADTEAILKRIAHVLQQTAGVDLQSYHQCRDKLDRIARRAQATANERQRLDKLAMQQFGPILKLFGR